MINAIKEQQNFQYHHYYDEAASHRLDLYVLILLEMTPSRRKGFRLKQRRVRVE